MPTPTIAAVTIGQSPRPDAIGELSLLLRDARWLEAGALDRLDDGAIAALAPGAGDFPLVTRLRDGRTTVVGEHAITPLMQAAVDRVDGEADAVIVMCAGRFAITSRKPLVFPGAVLAAVARELFFRRRVMVLTPHEAQVAPQRTHWNAQGLDADVRFASPYADTDFDAIGREAAASGAVAVLLDCFGYRAAAKLAVADASRLPVLLVRSLAARVLGELLP